MGRACLVQLGVNGVFADFIEGLTFYLQLRRQTGNFFPRRQVLSCTYERMLQWLCIYITHLQKVDYRKLHRR